MGLMDLLQQYANGTTSPSPNAAEHFDEVARTVPQQSLGQGISAAFSSGDTPPFHNMVARLFEQSNGQQRAGLLNQLLRSLGPGVLSSIAGGGLASALGIGAHQQAPEVTPEQATRVTPEQAGELAQRARAQDPTILDRVGDYYAQHPQVVKALGAAALAIALGQIAQRHRH
jgi:hypothetical protein